MSFSCCDMLLPVNEDNEFRPAYVPRRSRGGGGACRHANSHLKCPPFLVDLKDEPEWGDLKIEGYIGGKLVKTVTMSAAAWMRL